MMLSITLHLCYGGRRGRTLPAHNATCHAVPLPAPQADIAQEGRAFITAAPGPDKEQQYWYDQSCTGARELQGPPTNAPTPLLPPPPYSLLTWFSAQYIMSAACTNWYPEPLLHSSVSVYPRTTFPLETVHKPSETREGYPSCTPPARHDPLPSIQAASQSLPL